MVLVTNKDNPFDGWKVLCARFRAKLTASIKNREQFAGCFVYWET